MLLLAIDSSTRAASIAFLRGQDLLGEVAASPGQSYSTTFLGDLCGLLSRLGLALRDVDAFAVSVGPGSFTGVRIGLTATKAWSEIYRKPCVGVSQLEAIAASGARGLSLPLMVAPMLDAYRGQVFGGLYRVSAEGCERMMEDCVLSAPEFLDSLPKEAARVPQLFASPTPSALHAALEGSGFAGVPIAQTSSVLAASVGRLGHGKLLRGEVVDALRLDANYVRRTDAELHWSD